MYPAISPPYISVNRSLPEGVARTAFTARIERAHSYRARSASKKGTWPFLIPIFPRLLLLPSGAACLDSYCACRTSTFRACAFHEHRRPTGRCIPSRVSSLPHTPFSQRAGWGVPNRAHLNGQTFLHVFLYGRASVVVPLRPSSEHILIVRAPGAEDHTGFLNLFFSLLGGGLVNPQLRASNEGLPRPRVARAQGVHQAAPSLLTALSTGSYNPLKFLSVTN